jgi:hypothetical protein
MGCPKIRALVRSSSATVVDFYRQMGFAAGNVLNFGWWLIDD